MSCHFIVYGIKEKGSLVNDRPNELEASIVSLLGPLLVVAWATGDQMGDERVDGIGYSIVTVLRHGCIFVDSCPSEKNGNSFSSPSTSIARPSRVDYRQAALVYLLRYLHGGNPCLARSASVDFWKTRGGGLQKVGWR